MNKIITAFLLLSFALTRPASSFFSLEELELALNREPTNRPLVIEVVRRYHDLLLKEPEIKTWKKAIKYFDLLNSAYKIYRIKRGGRVDPVALAYYSSYQILRSVELGKKDSKLARYYAGPVVFGQAVADLDFALLMNPTDLEIRMIRGLNGFAYPGTNRLVKGVDDLRYVILAVEKDPRRGKGISLPDLYVIAGKCAQRAEDYHLAEGIWARLVRRYPETEQAEEAQKLIARYLQKAKFQKRVERQLLKKWEIPIPGGNQRQNR
jgi:tetratricopeptide (TPR) repeat protein